MNQQVAGVRVPERVVRNLASWRYRPQLLCLAAAAFIHRSAVDLDALTSLSSWPTLPNWSALVSAACTSACIGTILALLPFPRRTRMVGRAVSSDRSRVSTASASEILSPARHSIRSSSRAPGFGAERMRASTSWASRYSGSCSADFLLVVLVCGFGMLAPGATVALDGCGLLGCQSWTSGPKNRDGTLSPRDCPESGARLYRFKERVQLRGTRPDGTVCPILLHGPDGAYSTA